LEKSYNILLLKLIFRKFGTIRKITFQNENKIDKPSFRKKAYLEFSDLDSARNAVSEFKSKEETLSIKYLVKENRENLLRSLNMPCMDTIGLNSQNIHKIATAYNGVSFETREEELKRETLRQRLIEEMLEKEKDIIVNQY